ncbi:MAG: hypothetical protein GPW16_02945 [Euryarchaeota archaeon]|nr:hypothetical protein [Euryarchaeota archaeon]
MSIIILFLIVFLLSSIISGNNSTLILGPLRSSGIMGRNYSTLFVFLFILIGFILEGNKMLLSLNYITGVEIIPFYIFLSSLIIFFIFTLLSYPLSAGMVFTGAIIGFSLYSRSLKLSTIFIFISWILSFAISIILGYIIYNKISKRRKKSIGSRVTMIFLMSSSAFLSYTFGANTLGFLYAIDPNTYNFIAIILGIFFGTFFLNTFTYYNVKRSIVRLNRERAVVSQISSSIVVEIFTQLHMPVSITQGVMGSIIGTGFSKGYVEINLKRVNQLILSWAITPLFSAFMVMVMIMISPIL